MTTPALRFTLIVLLLLGAFASSSVARNNGDVVGIEIPEAFPKIDLPGEDNLAEERLREMAYIHWDRSRPLGTLWDKWLPMATLWVGGPEDVAEQKRQAWRRTLLDRVIDDDGYVSTHQHYGLGHPLGWPFPLWTQSMGAGWHFSTRGNPYGRELNIIRTTDVSDWTVESAEQRAFDESGWRLKLHAGETATLVSPVFAKERPAVHFLRLDWHPTDTLPADKLSISYEMRSESGEMLKTGEFRHIDIGRGMVASIAPLEIAWPNENRLRFALKLTADTEAQSPELRLHSFFTAVDTRHNINNAAYIIGCVDYYKWTGDEAFWQEVRPRLKRAWEYALTEFEVVEHGAVVTRWPGHEGTPGFIRHEDGDKTKLFGKGIGSNYWDLLPFGGYDAFATIYLYHAAKELAEAGEAGLLWEVEESGREPAKIAATIKSTAPDLFWNEETGRLMPSKPLGGEQVFNDYGYTFLNTAAVHYGFIEGERARRVLSWLTGERTVGGDTSTGDDIYAWRFGPRSSTRRNIDYYTYVWPDPESIPWGGQVQDGGAVLGFSFYDLMARAQTAGYEEAVLPRLLEITQWFDEVQKEGGVRAYYKKPGRGTLQGGGTAGGLGIDYEFFESAMLPSVAVHHLLGVEPGFGRSFTIDPAGVPVSMTDVAIKGAIVNIEISPRDNGHEVRIEFQKAPEEPLSVRLPDGDKKFTVPGGVPSKLSFAIPRQR